eukprot:Platyproteum_vivax@DN5205_c0_g1_i2.p1
MKAAVDAGMKAVEIDVWLTKDNEVIVVNAAKDGNVSETVGGNWNTESVEWRSLPKRLTALKPAWLTTVGGDRKQCEDYCLADADSVQRVWNAYREVQGDPANGHLLTLEEMLSQFQDSLQFNVELKGTKAELGPKVVKIMEKFKPGVVSRISSFGWITKDGYNPNNLPVDLLQPILASGVPLGLLASTPYKDNTTDTDWLLHAMEDHGCEWLHIKQDWVRAQDAQPHYCGACH